MAEARRSQATIAHNVSKSGDQISLYRQNGVFNFVHIKPDCGDNNSDDNINYVRLQRQAFAKDDISNFVVN